MSVDPADAAQRDYRVGFDWGTCGTSALAPACGVVVVVDVLSFGTAVDVATSAGARVLPLPWRDERARRAAERAGAVLAADRGTAAWSLSPSSLRGIDPDVLLGLPSPNGATLCAQAAETAGTRVFAGCLRNAGTVAVAAREAAGDGSSIGVIAAGERWDGADGSLRPAVEDLLGAGAVIDALGSGSPEAEVAATTFRGCRGDVERLLVESVSGRELAGIGYAHDVRLAAEVDVSVAAPRLRGGVLGSERAE